MNSHSARIMGTSLAFSMIVLAAGNAMAGGAPVEVERDTIGVFQSTGSTFFLRNANSAGPAAITASFGPADTVPLMGDYDNNNTDTLGAYSPSLGRFLLRNTNTEGPATTAFNYGPTNSTNVVALIGNWDGTGNDTPGLFERSGGRFLLRNANTAGVADVTTRYGPKNNTTMIPLRGNWNGGDSIDGIGLYDPAAGTFLLRNNPTSGAADISFRYGPRPSTLIPVVGDWDDDGIDTIGLYNPADGTFLLRDTNTAGSADNTFRFGSAGLVPVTGNFDGI